MSSSSNVDVFAFVRAMGDSTNGATSGNSDIELGAMRAIDNSGKPNATKSRVSDGHHLNTFPRATATHLAPFPKALVKGREDDVISRFSSIPRPAHIIIPRGVKFGTHQQHVHPGVFGDDEFSQLLEAPALYIAQHDILEGSVETEVQGIGFRLKVRSSLFSRGGPFITRGTRIVYNNVDSLTVSYFVTWLRYSDGITSLVQVNAFLLDQRTHHPYSTTWPALLLSVPAHVCFAPYSPSLTPSPDCSSPSSTLQTVSVTVQDLETIRKTSIFQFIWAKYFSSK